jgi:hypothetical protein
MSGRRGSQRRGVRRQFTRLVNRSDEGVVSASRFVFDRRVSGIAERRQEIHSALAEAMHRRHDDTCNVATCQCGSWNPETRRYELPESSEFDLGLGEIDGGGD